MLLGNKESTIGAHCYLNMFTDGTLSDTTDDLSQSANDQARFDIAYLNCITLEMRFSRFCFYFFRPVPSFQKMFQSQIFKNDMPNVAPAFY